MTLTHRVRTPHAEPLAHVAPELFGTFWRYKKYIRKNEYNVKPQNIYSPTTWRDVGIPPYFCSVRCIAALFALGCCTSPACPLGSRLFCFAQTSAHKMNLFLTNHKHCADHAARHAERSRPFPTVHTQHIIRPQCGTVKTVPYIL